MRSTSNLTIEWVKPDIAAERWEFSHHPDKQAFYLRHKIGWGEILDGFAAGRLVAYPRSGRLDGVPVELSYSSYDDYARYLAKAKRGYRRNYSLMEESLQRLGTLTLPAPIILWCGGEALLFSGYRRLCLAWNYGMAPRIWLLPVTPLPAPTSSHQASTRR
jgi:hypothetical protein